MSEFAAPRETVTAEARFETADMVVCVTCRMRYPAGTRFCTNDGSVLVPDVPVQAAMPHVEFSAAPRMQAPPVAAKRRSWVPIYAGAAMILLVMIAAPVWFLSFIRTAAPNIATNSNTSRNSNTPAYNFDTPDFQFQSLNGGTRSLNDFRGRVLLLNFWSTVGDETRNEAPGLNELQKRLGPRGLSVVGVSDTTSVDAIRNFQKETPLNYEVLIGGTPGIKLFRILTFPTTIIIDRRGHTTKRLLGVQDLATIESEIEPLLKQTP
jgi:peroxiredoxin